MFHPERRHFRPPQPTSQQHCQDRPIAQSFPGADIRGIQQRLRLLDREPVSQPHALGRHPFDPRDPVRQLRCQQAVVGSLDRQLAHRGDPDIDRDGTKVAGFQRDAPGSDGGLGETGSRLLAVPSEEFIQAEVVNPARNRRGNAIQDQGLQPAPFGGPIRQHQLVHLALVNAE
jgi:hypothetical protein